MLNTISENMFVSNML